MEKILKYFRQENGSTELEEISYDKALHIVLGSYRDCDMTRDMLTTANRIPCMASTINVYDYTDADRFFGNPKVLMAGMYCMIPSGIEYDEEGNRI